MDSSKALCCYISYLHLLVDRHINRRHNNALIPLQERSDVLCKYVLKLYACIRIGQSELETTATLNICEKLDIVHPYLSKYLTFMEKSYYNVLESVLDQMNFRYLTAHP